MAQKWQTRHATWWMIIIELAGTWPVQRRGVYAVGGVRSCEDGPEQRRGCTRLAVGDGCGGEGGGGGGIGRRAFAVGRGAIAATCLWSIVVKTFKCRSHRTNLRSVSSCVKDRKDEAGPHHELRGTSSDTHGPKGLEEQGLRSSACGCGRRTKRISQPLLSYCSSIVA